MINLLTKTKVPGWRGWLAFFGLASLFLVLRWNNYDAPLGRDEGEYAYSAQLLVQGIAPYQHAFIQKPPAVIYSYALSDLLLPGVYWAPRVLAMIFATLATALLGLIARLEFGPGYALPAMALATPMILLPRLDQVAASVELFMLLPLLATVAVYCYGRRDGNKLKYWFIGGFLAATTLLYKYTALPILAFVFVAWTIELWRTEGAKKIIPSIALAAGGGILASALGLGFFVIHDGGRSFWECTVVFNRYYAASNLFGPAYFWSECKDLWRNWWILFLVPWAILLQPSRRVWIWLGVFGCSIFGTNGGCYGQYYIPIMPFWALLSAAGIGALALHVSKWIAQPAPRVAGVATIVVLLLVLWPDAPWMFYSNARFAHEKMEESPFIEAPLAAIQVVRRSSPDDFIFVAGSEPEILYYAQRYSPTRFITSYALMDPTPLAIGYQQEAIHDLQEHPPKLIVFVQWGNSWTRQATSPPEFMDFMGDLLKEHYMLSGGYVKADIQNGYWTTNASAAEFKKSSLLLYERKSVD
jgi:hypothetical protein